MVRYLKRDEDLKYYTGIVKSNTKTFVECTFPTKEQAEVWASEKLKLFSAAYPTLLSLEAVVETEHIELYKEIYRNI